MEYLILILLIIAWLASPIVLLILYLVKRSENKGLIKRAEQAEQLLQQTRMHNEVLRKRILELNPEAAQQMEPEQAAAPVQAVAQESNAMAEASVVPEQAAAPVQAVASEQVTTPVQPVAQAPVQPVYTAPSPAQVAPVQPKQPKQLSTGVILFGIGTLLVLLAGTIFATTSWKVLPAGGKIAVLLGAVAVFFVGALIAEKKLKLRNTSITFYILGSTFLAVTNLAAGYFGWYGIYWLDTKNQLLIWALSAILSSACLIIGAIVYKAKILGVLGYDFLVLGVVLIAAFAADNMYVFAIITGLFMILSRVYIRVAEYEKEHDSVTVCVDILGYIQNFLVIMLSLFYENNIYDEPFQIDGAIVALNIILTLINLCMTIWHVWMVYGSERLRTKFVRRISCVISASLAIATVGAADRLLTRDIYRVLLSLIIYIAIYVAMTALKKKGKDVNLFKWFAEAYSVGLLMLGVFISLADDYYKDFTTMIFVLLAIAILIYVIQHINKNNIISVVNTLGIVILVIEIINIIDMDRMPTLCAFILLALVAAVTTLGRFMYGKIVSFTEEHKYIDWMSLLGFIWVIAAMVSAFSGESDAIQFIVVLLSSLYFVSYAGRINPFLDKIMLTVAVLWACYTGLMQPFFDIPYEFESEWVIAFMLIATYASSWIWRKYRKAFGFIWAAVIAIAFIGQFSTTADTYGVAEPIRVVKLVLLIIGMLLLFIVAFLKKSKLFLVETGFVLAFSSFMALAIDLKGLFIFMCLLGAAYLLYLQYSGMSFWSFLPVIQIYILLIVYEIPLWAWLVTFIVALALGLVLHHVWDSGKSLADDWINISGIIPILAIVSDGHSKWVFCAEMMLVVFIMSFYKRYKEDSNHILNKLILSCATGVSAIAWISQPWFDVPDLFGFEWVAIAFIGFCLVNMLFIYKDMTSELWGWITFAVSSFCVIVQGISAIGTGEVFDALILGIAMLVLLVLSYGFKKKQWFMLAAITLVLQSIYASRKFWLSIAWWVYLLAAGAILIMIAARSEYKKRISPEDNETAKRQWFKDWTL